MQRRSQSIVRTNEFGQILRRCRATVEDTSIQFVRYPNFDSVAAAGADEMTSEMRISPIVGTSGSIIRVYSQ